MQFEVQIRTVLQHAWAEIEHDRSYKFSSELPTPIRRRLNLLAGMLEIVDREFSILAQEVDEYGKEIKRMAKEGDLANAEITFISIKEFLNTSSKIPVLESSDLESTLNIAVKELKYFGVSTIADFDNLISKDYLKKFTEIISKNTLTGFIRDVMMYSDIDQYFEKSWQMSWNITDSKTKDFLISRYSINKVKSIFSRHNLYLGDPETGEIIDF
jgi:putative GTP pyrophosphokinase